MQRLSVTNSDPSIAFKQVAAALVRQRVMFFAEVQGKMRTQTSSAMSRYKEPDAVQRQRNATLQRNHDAAVVPEGHWTRNKYLNNFSEHGVEPMAQMAIGEGVGSVVMKGVSLAFKGLAAKTSTSIKYLGRPEDLKSIPRSQTLIDDLPYLRTPKANYYQNMSVVRKNLREGVTFKDASWFRPNSEPAPTLSWPTRTVGQTFYGAERNLMQNRGLWPK